MIIPVLVPFLRVLKSHTIFSNVLGAFDWSKSLSKPNQKILEPEPGLVLTLSSWYKTSSNLDVHLPEPGHLHFVQVHFTTDKIRPGSAKIFFSGT